MPTYDEYEDDHLDNAPKEPKICNNIFNHLEEDEGLEWDISSCSSSSESPCQQQCISPDFWGEKKDPKWDVSFCSSNS